MISRRSSLAQLAAAYSLLALARMPDALAGTARKDINGWIDGADGLAAALKGEAVTVADWRDGIDSLFRKIPLGEISAGLDFDRVAARTRFADKGVATARLKLPGGQSRPLHFIPKLFAVGTGRSIIPHGHDNMVSAHLVMQGRFHLRQYDQLSRSENALLIKPRRNGIIRPGDLSSIGEDVDNVHWFMAEEPSFTLDVIVTGLDDGKAKAFDIFNIDIAGARAVYGDVLEARRMTVPEALAKYG